MIIKGIVFGVLYWGIACGVVYAGICLIQKYDKGNWNIPIKRSIVFIVFAGISSMLIVYVSNIRCSNVSDDKTCNEVRNAINIGKTRNDLCSDINSDNTRKGAHNVICSNIFSKDEADGILLSIVAGCLLFACLTDSKNYEVFQFTWWIGGAAGGILLCRSVTMYRTWVWNKECLLSLAIYIFLQEMLFAKMYGRADCHAFVVCAVVECAFGMKLREYLWQMLFAFGGLAVVQAFRHNINRKGNLKEPVAFLPYVTFSFWTILVTIQSHANL